VKILLDTCSFIWWVTGAPMPDQIVAELSNAENEVLLSAASAWEMVIKHQVGRLDLTMEPATFVREGRRRHFIEELPIGEEAALHLVRLPDYHKDPFDRILIAQAIVGGCAIATPDPLIHRYPVRAIW
jgi:PIN domain nuclease of toxin-antitoxin system